MIKNGHEFINVAFEELSEEHALKILQLFQEQQYNSLRLFMDEIERFYNIPLIDKLNDYIINKIETTEDDRTRI